MYAIMTLFTAKHEMREEIEKLVDGMSTMLNGLKGFKSHTFLFDPEVHEYGGITLWESKEDAEAALAATGPRLQEALSEMIKAPPTRHIFEVYEPKT